MGLLKYRRDIRDSVPRSNYWRGLVPCPIGIDVCAPYGLCPGLSMGPSCKFWASYRRFRSCSFRSIRGTRQTDRQTDRQKDGRRLSFYNAPTYGDRGIIRKYMNTQPLNRNMPSASQHPADKLSSRSSIVKEGFSAKKDTALR